MRSYTWYGHNELFNWLVVVCKYTYGFTKPFHSRFIEHAMVRLTARLADSSSVQPWIAYTV